jgi:hypothetical protein
MMYVMKHKSLALFVGALLFFSACKKDADNSSEPPVTEPLSVAAAKPGDTIVVKGTNFSKVASENVVKFNGVEATVVTASDTELKIVVPANATSGAVIVTVHGNTVEVGSIVIAPLTFYVIKGDFRSGAVHVHQLITMDPETGKESLVLPITGLGSSSSKLEDVIYLRSTNEMVGVIEQGTQLMRINVATKQITKKVLTTSTTIDYYYLVTDNQNNLYAVKRDKTDQNHLVQSLVKIDPQTGSTTVIKTFEHNEDWEELKYITASNEIVGLIDEGAKLFKVNLTTKDASFVNLPVSGNLSYDELVVDNKSNLYGIKTDGNMGGANEYVSQFLKVDAATGKETLLTALPTDGKFHSRLLFVPQRNEFISFYNQIELFRINATTYAIARKPLGTVYDGLTYDYFSSN